MDNVCALLLFDCIAAVFLAKPPPESITLHIAQILLTGGMQEVGCGNHNLGSADLVSLLYRFLCISVDQFESE